VTDDRLKKLRTLIKKLGAKFNRVESLDRALTHSSSVHEDTEGLDHDNESLEFLGDAVLGLVISDHLFNTFPDYSPGDYSKLKASLVSKSVLAKKARELQLGDYLHLGRGEEMTGGRTKDSVLADALEAVIGAVFSDQGYEAAEKFVVNLLQDRIAESVDGPLMTDYKSRLQNYFQEQFKELPEYKVVRESGPDHKRTFEVEITAQGKVVGQGRGRSKKSAEQAAAKEALFTLAAAGLLKEPKPKRKSRRKGAKKKSKKAKKAKRPAR
jgi:ribonuclease-3